MRNDLDHMYLNINGDGAAYEFSDAALQNGTGRFLLSSPD